MPFDPRKVREIGTNVKGRSSFSCEFGFASRGRPPATRRSTLRTTEAYTRCDGEAPEGGTLGLRLLRPRRVRSGARRPGRALDARRPGRRGGRRHAAGAPRPPSARGAVALPAAHAGDLSARVAG